ncbi:MAG: ParB N-terminal domain-containing protein [Oscillospiraceae bacterium]|nr:ParB N-terminal domain-containing protein [Oscillospiraceae bacterium]
MTKFDISSMVEVPDSVKKGVRLIDIKSLVPYKQHCFTLYSGERLDDMVRSIQNNGVIVPIIVRNIPDSDKFEILSGHNRVYAAGMAGKKNVPAIVKENLSDTEAEVYVIETNLIQRGFKDLKISEQAFAVGMRYKKLFDSRKLKDIDSELLALENGKPVNENCYPVDNKVKGRSVSYAAEEYGISTASVSRLLRINELTEDLKKMVDEGSIKIRTAVELSYIPHELQAYIYTVIQKHGIETVDMKTAKQLRDIVSSYSNPSKKLIEETLIGEQKEPAPKEKAYKVTVPTETYTKYFENVPKKEISGIIEKALNMYFESVKNAV